jgi:ferredoxin
MSSPLHVTFLPGGQRVAWRDDLVSLLDLAEACGLTPDFSCRAGVCNTCRVPLLAGEVRHVVDPLDPPGPGAVLLCCSEPVTDVTVQL